MDVVGGLGPGNMFRSHLHLELLRIEIGNELLLTLYLVGIAGNNLALHEDGIV